MTNNKVSPMTQEQLARLGGGAVAYVKPMKSEELARVPASPCDPARPAIVRPALR
jgi:hypothetical protein